MRETAPGSNKSNKPGFIKKHLRGIGLGLGITAGLGGATGIVKFVQTEIADVESHKKIAEGEIVDKIKNPGSTTIDPPSLGSMSYNDAIGIPSMPEINNHSGSFVVRIKIDGVIHEFPVDESVYDKVSTGQKLRFEYDDRMDKIISSEKGK